MMKTPLSIIAFSSDFHGASEDSVRKNHIELFRALDDAFDIRLVVASKESTLPEIAGTAVVFIASGGTEGILRKHYAELPKPLTLLTDGKANSLAASLEISCWVRKQGGQCRILHDEPEQIVATIHELELRDLMRGQRIGVLGEPSDWLISSNVDYTAAEQRWGTKFVDIPISWIEEYYKAEPSENCEAEADRFIASAKTMIEPNRDEVIKAVRLYHAIRRVVDEEQLNAVTVRCFDLITSCATTGCLALSLLNDEGIVAGCEGDLPSIFTMLLCKRLTGADAFMANPARIRDKEVLFAHCTIGLKQTQQYIVRSHFESGTGVAIQGRLREHQPVTVVKAGGEQLDKIAFAKAILTENQNDPQKCRTQILLRTTDSNLSEYLLNNSIGNHHIILQGNYVPQLECLCRTMGLVNEVKP